MTSSSTDLRATEDRRRRTRLGWLVAVLVVAVAGPAVASTSALYTSEGTTVGTFTVASDNGVALESAWGAVLRWRFEANGEPTGLAAAHGPAFLPLDATDAVTLAADSTSGPVPLSLTGDWTIALWVVPGAEGRVLTLDGPSFTESVRLDISTGGRVMVTGSSG